MQRARVVKPRRLIVERQFAMSRLGPTHLATAYERLVPCQRRQAGTQSPQSDAPAQQPTFDQVRPTAAGA
jgi:hypothetical protein